MLRPGLGTAQGNKSMYVEDEHHHGRNHEQDTPAHWLLVGDRCDRDHMGLFILWIHVHNDVCSLFAWRHMDPEKLKADLNEGADLSSSLRVAFSEGSEAP